MSGSTDALRSLPSVDRVVGSDAMLPVLDRFPRAEVVRAVRELLTEIREGIRAGRAFPAPGGAGEAVVDAEGVAALVLPRLAGWGTVRVINATGIVAHTGLGRAVLPPDAVAALADAARGYSLLAVDRETGERATRYRFCEELLTEITGAEAACVVNNNAAATLLVLNTLAEGREVVISRGQLVEIGGAFRIPDVLRRGGARLVEVGCTNKTHLRDYAAAIGPDTGLLMRVHMSNYRMVGFTSEVPIAELAPLGRERGVPVFDDLGAGAFVDLRPMGFPEEPLVRDSVRAGADVISMSADKLIGGPQGGIIVGRREIIDRVHDNPLYRAVRVGKLTLLTLQATLRYFLDRRRALAEHPTTRMLTMGLEELSDRATAIAAKLEGIRGIAVEVVLATSEVGSGAYPAHSLPTYAVSLAHATLRPDELARRLRLRPVPVFARVKDGRVLFDPRTVQDGEGDEIVDAVREIVAADSPATH